MSRALSGALLGLAAFGLWASSACAADPTFRVTVSPEVLSFPDSMRATYRVEVTTGADPERFTLNVSTVPAFVGFDGVTEGSGLPLPGPVTLEGAGALTPGVSWHGDPVCTTALSLRVFHGGLTYGQDYHLELPADSVSTVVLPTQAPDAPWPGEQFRLALGVVNSGGLGQPGTLDGGLQLTAPRVTVAGRTGVRMKIASDQPSAEGCAFDPPDNAGVPITITGRTDPPLAGHNITIVVDSANPRSATSTGARELATVPVAGDGTFVLRDWRPQDPARYAIQARFKSNVPELADDFSRPLSFDLTNPVPTPVPGWVRIDARWVVLNVSPSGRVLKLRYESGGCLRNGLAEATEHRDRVAIRVSQEKPADPQAVCTSDLRYPTLQLRLKDPIAGRALPGMRNLFIPRGLGGRWLIPRVTGLRAIDARRVLRAQGFAVRGDRGGTVVRQRPRAGTAVRVAGGMVVTLAARKRR